MLSHICVSVEGLVRPCHGPAALVSLLLIRETGQGGKQALRRTQNTTRGRAAATKDITFVLSSPPCDQNW